MEDYLTDEPRTLILHMYESKKKISRFIILYKLKMLFRYMHESGIHIENNIFKR